jgi:hypothetical protein
MEKSPYKFDQLVGVIDEQTKELSSIYEFEEILHNPNINTQDALETIPDLIQEALEAHGKCSVVINYRTFTFQSSNKKEYHHKISSEIIIRKRRIGLVTATFKNKRPKNFDLEKDFIRTTAFRIGEFLLYRRLKAIFSKWESTKQEFINRKTGEWQVVLELLRRTDPELFFRISRKMLNYLIWQGYNEAEDILKKFTPYMIYEQEGVIGEKNSPLERHSFEDTVSHSKEIFEIARQNLENETILTLIQNWIQQDKTSFLVRVTANNNSSLTDISQALRRYFQIAPQGLTLASSIRTGVSASLIRRFFSDQLEYINITKKFVGISDFSELVKRMIFPVGSHGKLGGKSAGLFLAEHIVNKHKQNNDLFTTIKTPKTWYITSDAMILFMDYNNLEDILEQKYKTVEEIRKEYPHVIQLFKTSHFPPQILQGLSMALDDFGDHPLIVRSSSLLEDRLGAAFSGKYKSLFISNQGTKQEKLQSLTDAVAEVYASTLGPDPIEYRSTKGLLDFHEEMGIMIQEVVGQKIGEYFFPAYAGVAFSSNEFLWSPRIKQNDGLARIVPGLGTRAVDRIGNDYPIMIAPGQPDLRTNITIEEITRYSPKYIDAINLENNRFDTIEIKELFKKYGHIYPNIEKIVSIFQQTHLAKANRLMTDFTKEDLVVTFEGIFKETPFIKMLNSILNTLRNELKGPVDIEFACDEKNFYLLQCRPQSHSTLAAPAKIPKNLIKENIIFTANKFVSNGALSDIQYLVYVSPEAYSSIDDLAKMKDVGKAIGKLNKTLPARKFILLGPGRWGSRGDIKMGVNVTYSDINNTSALIEIARKKGDYTPDLSFGTHFFQDLVEAKIKYLPLYPDEKRNIFRDNFFSDSTNVLADFAPKYNELSNVIKVIDVKPRIFKLLMNAENNHAIGFLDKKE